MNALALAAIVVLNVTTQNVDVTISKTQVGRMVSFPANMVGKFEGPRVSDSFYRVPTIFTTVEVEGVRQLLETPITEQRELRRRIVKHDSIPADEQLPTGWQYYEIPVLPGEEGEYDIKGVKPVTMPILSGAF